MNDHKDSPAALDDASIEETLDTAGRVDFLVAVRLEDSSGVLVAEATVAWHLRMNA